MLVAGVERRSKANTLLQGEGFGVGKHGNVDDVVWRTENREEQLYWSCLSMLLWVFVVVFCCCILLLLYFVAVFCCCILLLYLVVAVFTL